MRKYCLLFFLLAFKLTAFAQVDTTSMHEDTAFINAYKEASPESQAYNEYRLYTATPPYGLQKIYGLIKKIKADEDGNEALAAKTYNSLSFREKFTYNMIHPEAYSQNCDAMPPIQDEQKKIFAQLPDAFGEIDWSDRQRKFFIDNRDSVMNVMKQSISRTRRVGLNYKLVIADINAKEMIPFLVTTYNLEKKDHDILTVLMLIMKDNNYQPFLSSASYKKLYGEDGSYEAYLNFNKANEELIIKRATDFYNGISK